MRILKYTFFLLFVCTQALAGQIRIPDTDYRSYHSIILDSGLEVLLVHDQRASKSAAAVALPIGSLEDPKSQPGLAHYLEHMLFLGSEEYPGAEEYQAFITKNGGETNAATGYTSTTYMLELDPPAFAEALHRMVDTLGRPLLSPVYADKERSAVNAEMESKKHSDGRRLAMLGFSTLNPAHPGTHFTGGNLDTLSDKPGSKLHDELVKFHHTWYSANLMKAVLYGPQSLDELEGLARKEFSAIPNRHAKLPVVTIPAVTPAEEGVRIGVQPVRKTQSLSIEFVLPQDLDDYQTKPLQTVAAVIGAETPHSLAQTLRDRGLALSLSAGGDTDSLRNAVTFSIHIQLTESGDTRRDEVLGLLFAYFDLLRAQGVPQGHFDQLRNMFEMQFRFAPLTSGFDFVASAADSMLEYPIEDVLYGPYRLDSQNREAIGRILSALRPDKARIFHVGASQPADKQAFFYQTPYSMRPIAKEETETWSVLAAKENVQLPELNPFVPDDFRLADREMQTNATTTVLANLANNPGLTVWFAQSEFRKEPKAILLARLQSAALGSTLEQAAMRGILLKLWDQEQAGLANQAQEAGLSVSIGAEDGLEIRIEGFSQRQEELLVRTLAFLDQPVDQQAFELARAEQLREIANLEKQGLFGQAMGMMNAMLRVPSWDRTEVLPATQAVTLDAFNAYLRGFRDDLRISLFGFGNFSSDVLRRIAARVQPFVGTKAGSALPTTRIQPVAGVHVDFRRKSVLDDSALADVYLATEAGPASKAKAMLLEGLLSTKFYAQLRTEEQLGYLVNAFPIMVGQYCGIGFGVQSPVQGTGYLEGRFRSFYPQFATDLAGIDTEEFEQVRQGLIASMTKTPDTLDEEFGWIEGDLRIGNTAFDSRAKIVAALKAARLVDVVEFYESMITKGQSTRLLIQVQGKRFEKNGWAEDKAAGQAAKPSDAHVKLGRQVFRGL